MTQINVHRPTLSPRPRRAARWGGFSDFFDDFLNERGPSFNAPVVRSRGVYPPVNLHESADAFVLTAELPGVAPEDIDVSLEGKTVTLSGQRKVDYAAGDGVAVHVELLSVQVEHLHVTQNLGGKGLVHLNEVHVGQL